jgi:diguanylate cyclase (GGDEF)-like protein
MVLVAGVEGYFGVLLTLPVLTELWLMGLLAGIALWAQMAQLHKLLSLYRQATRDSLTSLFNRRAIMERLMGEYHRANRYDHPMTVVLFDLDRFKRINDTYGHLTGDAVLKTFARLLTNKLRTTDLVGRYGGEEFLALLSETGVHAARELAERIRSACEKTPMHGPHDEVVNVTVSGGVAELAHDEDIPGLLERVDEFLYNAKKQGRNRVVTAE